MTEVSWSLRGRRAVAPSGGPGVTAFHGIRFYLPGGDPVELSVRYCTGRRGGAEPEPEGELDAR